MTTLLSKKRCAWVNLENPLYVKYHDKEWGKPQHNDCKHFEMLTLEGAQAGLSWETILKKRENYREVFLGFDPTKVAKFSLKKINELLDNPGIVRNKLKLTSTISNAKAFLEVQQEFGSFDKYIWNFVNNKPIVNSFKNAKDYPTKTFLSDVISKDLKKRGFRFVGSTIIYAYMQAVGLVNDHAPECFRHKHDWFVYIVKSANGTLYTGVTNNVERRFNDHQIQGKKCAKYLRGKKELQLVFRQRIGEKSLAHKIEWQIKNLSKKNKERIIEQGFYKAKSL